MRLIDSHCHLNLEFSPEEIAQLIQEAKAEGVFTLITIGTDIDGISAIQTISETYPEVYHTIGIHPHETDNFSTSTLETLAEKINHPKCKALGEIGLDFYYCHSQKAAQIDALERQLNFAIQAQKPVVIHSRDAEAELLHCLSQYASKWSTPNRAPGVIHCFSGTLDFGKKCLDLGFYISFSGILTFKKADEVRAAAVAFPLERLLVETDAPFLAPIPHRGKKCVPKMVKLTAEKLAELKKISLEDLSEITTRNSQAFFQI